jgi:predicted O-methyltransferase YrrM
MTDRSSLLEAIETAYEFAKGHIDLSGCCYGPHGKGPFLEIQGYYFFLAGLVAQLRCSRILEIGTHCGGSIFSMTRGVEYAGLRPSAEIVTVDLKDKNREGFQRNRIVKRVIGNCYDDAVAQKVALSFTGHVDLMFVDHHHDCEHTNRCLERYLPLVSPRLVVLDDIRLNPSMAKLWGDLSVAYGEMAIDVTDASRREKKVGFGLLICESS